MKLAETMAQSVTDYLAGSDARIPEGGEFYWTAFSELAGQRGSGQGGANPLAFSEIESWSRLMRVPMEPHQVRVLLAMDRAWLNCARARKSNAVPIAGELSVEAFDVVIG